MYPFINKMNFYTALTHDEKAALQECVESKHHFSRGQTLARPGDTPESVDIVTEGWACRLKSAHDGSDQVIAFVLPGDLCDDLSPVPCRFDHGIRALSDIRITRLDRRRLLSQLTPDSGLAQGLAWASAVDRSIMGEWLLNVTRRPAVMRLAHLLCELFARCAIIGRTEGNSMYFPLTQVALSEALGLSPVHLNRSLQLLRRRKLISLCRRTLTIMDWPQLAEFAGFDNNYLHLGGTPPTSLRLAS
ncbi:Crp/Fnr family transcriptional regulator [Kushneria sp. AK178]